MSDPQPFASLGADRPASRGAGLGASLSIASSITTRRTVLSVLGGAASTLLAGCAVAPRREGAPPETEDPRLRPWTEGWSRLTLPGKRPTDYQPEWQDGRAVLRAQAEQSAALWRRTTPPLPAGQQPGELRFSWKTNQLLDDADVAVREHEDAVARVILGFGGDTSRLSARNRLLFELSQTLTGEEPPFATLMYVWDTRAPVDSLIISPRTDRIRKIVVESGPAQLGQWRRYRRDVQADFLRAYEEPPGPLLSLAVMTDTDNTQSVATTWYADLSLQSLSL